MSGDTKMKWVYSFILLAATLGWAAFCVVIVRNAVVNPTELNVIEASGTSVLLGALITWCGTVNQHWFRKKDAE